MSIARSMQASRSTPLSWTQLRSSARNFVSDAFDPAVELPVVSLSGMGLRADDDELHCVESRGPLVCAELLSYVDVPGCAGRGPWLVVEALALT